MLDDSRYDGDVSAVFTDVLTGEVLYERNGGTPRVPASSLKLLTAVAAFAHLGPEYRFPTTVVEGPDADTVVLVGGGDVTLTRDGKGYFRGEGASLAELAELVLEARGGDAPSTVVLDTSLFTDDRRAPGTIDADYGDGATAEMTPLMVDAGRIDNTKNQTARHADPAMEAAEAFADLLGADTVERGTAPDGAAEVAVVHSAPIARLADEFVMRSDNTLTDAVGLRVGLAVHGEMTWKAATDALVATLEDLGVDTTGVTLSDTSGLSKDNRMTAHAFTQMLAAAATDDEAGAVFATLPIAGHNGTLRDRFFTATDGYGIVRAKTGALSGVSSLTGSVVTEDGRQIVFSLISNGHSNNWELQTALDETATAVAGCGC
jgi:D-alanyl-D-alanine carboxypeptidase/D-alanyl-D-alanine-endopeptidase (penicillin-binding protein 4)